MYFNDLAKLFQNNRISIKKVIVDSVNVGFFLCTILNVFSRRSSHDAFPS